MSFQKINPAVLVIGTHQKFHLKCGDQQEEANECNLKQAMHDARRADQVKWTKVSMLEDRMPHWTDKSTVEARLGYGPLCDGLGFLTPTFFDGWKWMVVCGWKLASSRFLWQKIASPWN